MIEQSASAETMEELEEGGPQARRGSLAHHGVLARRVGDIQGLGVEEN
jgi:hypothetical protein